MRTLEQQAEDSNLSVCAHNGVDTQGMSPNEIEGVARKFSAPCRHKWDRPYRGSGTRVCTSCGGLQNN
jgi:hypothetical protein